MTAAVVPIKRKSSKEKLSFEEATSDDSDPTQSKQRSLVIDIGGSSVKFLVSGEARPRTFKSGKKLTPGPMVERLVAETQDWTYDVVTVGYPGLVSLHGPCSEPGNLGRGWVGFDFAAAFNKPVKVVNDAAMQAVGSYDGGRMLFIGLGTGLGSALIADRAIVTLELGSLWWDGTLTAAEALGKNGLKKLGEERWRSAVERFVHHAMLAFKVDYVVIGGGNAKKLKKLPPGSRIGHNLTAFRGGMRMWEVDHVPTLSAVEAPPLEAGTKPAPEWRMI